MKVLLPLPRSNVSRRETPKPPGSYTPPPGKLPTVVEYHDPETAQPVSVDSRLPAGFQYISLLDPVSRAATLRVLEASDKPECRNAAAFYRTRRGRKARATTV